MKSRMKIREKVPGSPTMPPWVQGGHPLIGLVEINDYKLQETVWYCTVCEDHVVMQVLVMPRWVTYLCSYCGTNFDVASVKFHCGNHPEWNFKPVFKLAEMLKLKREREREREREFSKLFVKWKKAWLSERIKSKESMV